MWRLALGLSTAASFAVAQKSPMLQLDGIVVDESGKPIAGARIDHTGNNRVRLVTDAGGRFAITCASPLVVIRKIGFQSHPMKLPSPPNTRVVLQRSPVSQHLPFRKGSPPKRSPFTFHFSRVPSELNANRESQDIDYVARSYSLRSGQNKSAVVHGRGSMWSFILPSDLDVAKSVEYSERVYSDRGLIANVEARGKFASGTFWRTLTGFGESVGTR